MITNERIKLTIDHVGESPRYATTYNTFNVAAFLFYKPESPKALALLVDGNAGATITNAADLILPFIHRQHFGRHAIRWIDVRWIYRDSSGDWDEILLTHWDGGRVATVGFKPVGDRTQNAAFAAAEEAGFALNSDDRAHIRNAIALVRP